MDSKSWIPTSTKWSAFKWTFSEEFCTISDDAWNKLSKENKAKVISDTIANLVKRIPSEILIVLIKDFWVADPALPQLPTTGILTQTISEEDIVELGYRYNTKQARTTTIKNTFSEFQKTNTPDQVRVLLMSFLQKIQSLVSASNIQIWSSFYALLPKEARKTITKFHMDVFLQKNNLNQKDLDTFMHRFGKAISPFLHLDKLLDEYYELFIEPANQKPFTNVDLQSLALVMGQDSASDLLRKLAPRIAQIAEQKRSPVNLEPVQADIMPLDTEWFSFHMNQWKPRDMLRVWFDTIFQYYTTLLPLVMRGLWVYQDVVIRFEMLDACKARIESKLWKIIDAGVKIKEDERDFDPYLRFAIKYPGTITDTMKQNIYTIFRQQVSGINTAMQKLAWVPEAVISWFHKHTSWTYSEWVFSDEWLAWDHMAIVSENDTDIVYVTLQNFSVDVALYLLVQFDRILKWEESWDKTDTWTHIMNGYNRQLLWNNDVFPIARTPQYTEFIKHIVVPNSAGNETSPKNHILLCGLPWTWKSQYTFNLLTQEEYLYKDKPFDRTSIVVPMSADQFTKLVSDDSSTERSRILQIHERTRKHILIVIEDIDSLVREDQWENGLNSVAQKLTNFFDWIGKTSYVTVVATSNYPHLIPTRLARKGRFAKVLEFNAFANLDEVKDALWIYIKKYSLSEYRDYIMFYAEQMIGFTWSMVADFLQDIDWEIKFRKLTNNAVPIVERDINHIFRNLHTSRSDFEQQAIQMKNWLCEIRNGQKKIPPGFGIQGTK
jgi:hypothetical protein